MSLRGVARSSRASRWRLWVALVGAVVVISGVALVLSHGTPEGGVVADSPIVPTSPSASVPSPTPTATEPPVTQVGAAGDQLERPAGEPATLDFRLLATAAARTIYTWDTRTATYSETYGRLRSWWHVLPDGSNPLTVFADQFEATGTNAAAYASLAGSHGYRTATAETVTCDAQLAQFVEHPAPWEGLHVCTVTLAVTEHATSGTNSYTAPISIVVNCPPATTAPVDRCEMVAFYASSDRIVY